MAGQKIDLTGARETLLMTLYGKALESRLPNSLLQDRFATRRCARSTMISRGSRSMAISG
jgi:O-methyltransferase involved in polyketide biosynthesis